MRRIYRRFLLGSMLLSISVFALAGKRRKDIPAAPLPGAISKAQKIFVTNGGGSDLAYDEFYSQLKTWGRFAIVSSPSEAELIVELRYAVENDGTKIWSSTNTYTGKTQIYSKKMVDPQLFLNIYEAKTKDLLWSITDHRRLARLEKNVEKETINSSDRLIDELKQRIGPPSPTVEKP